jgi:hypothetical protein
MLKTENQAVDQYEKEITGLKVSGWGKNPHITNANFRGN